MLLLKKKKKSNKDVHRAGLVLGGIRTQMGSVFIIFHALFGASVPSLLSPPPAVTWHQPQRPGDAVLWGT